MQKEIQVKSQRLLRSYTVTAALIQIHLTRVATVYKLKHLYAKRMKVRPLVFSEQARLGNEHTGS